MKKIPSRLIFVVLAAGLLAQSPPPAQTPGSDQTPAPKTFPEYHPPGTKGGPMVLVSDFKFYIDKYEVTNQDYQECVAAGVCKKRKSGKHFDAPEQPMVGVINQNYARTFCQWAGKRLPKDQEWQEAGQGTDGRMYPWGNDPPNCNLANYQYCKIGRTLPVGSKPAGASPYGAMDMAGNVWELVEEGGVYRGGGWGSLETFLILLRRYPDFARGSEIGFRCARDGSP